MKKETLVLTGADYEHTLTLGGIREGLNIRYETAPPNDIFKKMIAERSYEACEFSLANYMVLKDRGADWLTAIPVFPNRNFRHSALIVTVESNLIDASQLRGKRIGVEEYSMTAAAWVRGLLNEEYGVHWSDMNWHCAEQSRRFEPPKERHITYESEDLETLLLEGKIDVLISSGPRDDRLPRTKHRLRRLFSEPEVIECEYYKRTRIFPINHCVVLRSDVLESSPEIAKILFSSYSDSKKRAYERRLGSTLLPWSRLNWKNVFDIFSNDPLPYGLTDENRLVITKLAEYLHEQELTKSLLQPDALFTPAIRIFREAHQF